MKTLSKTILLLAALMLSVAGQTQAAPKHVFKIGSLAPAGSVWVEQFEQFAAEVEENTGGEVGFKVYPGGVMGDDLAMHRKMRVRQLHGGGFTMTGISSVVPDFRVMAIPFVFSTYDEVDYVKDGLTPIFRQRFRDKGLEFIAMTEVGFIYAMSTKPISTLEELQQATNWSPTGDPISEAYMTALGITPVQLTIPDVLAALQSGLVDTVYNSLYGAIVLQWFTKAKYLVDIPYGYAYGVFALDAGKFDQLSPQQQEVIHQAAANHFPVLLTQTRVSNEQSHQVLADQGVEFLAASDVTAGKLREKRDVTIKKLVPSDISQEVYDTMTALLAEYQQQKTSQ